jgi:hypothetical protein
MKKTVIFLLALICLSLSFVGCENTDDTKQSLNPSPIEDFEFEAGENGLTVTKYLGNAKKIVIPSVVDNKKVVAIKKEVFGGNIVVEEILLSDYMTDLDFGCFNGCDNLKSITLGIRDEDSYSYFNAEKLSKNLTTIVFSKLKTIDISFIEYLRSSAPSITTFVCNAADKIEILPISRNASGGYNIIVSDSLFKNLNTKTAHLYNCVETENNKSFDAWILDDAALEIDLDLYNIKQIDRPDFWSKYFSDIDLILEDYQNNGCTIIDTKYYVTPFYNDEYSFGFIYKDANGNLNYHCALEMFFYEHNDYNEYSCTYTKSKTDPDLAFTTAFGRVDSITVNGTTYSYDHK